MNSALNESRTDASGCETGIIVGCTRTATPRVGLLGHREQLHRVAELGRRLDVGVGDPADALAVHVTGHHACAEGDRRDDRGLRRGVEALDVGRGVALGVAETLRLGQRVVERRARLGHAAEDVVGRAVHDAEHPTDAVAGERLAQRADERDAAGDRRLEQQVDPGALRGLEQLAADVGEQLLVRGDDGLARLERLDDELACGLDAADDLDDDVDVVGDHDRGRVVGEHRRRERHVALEREVAHRDPRHLEAHPRARLDLGARAR